MPGGFLAVTKKGLCLSLLMLVTFVMSLPRAQEALGPRGSTFALTGRLSRLASSLLPASTSKSGTDGLDMRLLKVRKFRRRRTTFGFTPHVQASYHQAPILNDTGH